MNACATNPVVTNTNDSGAGSLRAALANICTAPNNNITFNIPAADPGHVAGVYTITLASELVVAKNVNITGPNSVTNTNPIVVSGNNASRVFNVNSGKTATIRQLRITGGNSVTVGGAIYSEGTLNLINSTVGGSTGLHGGGIYSSPTGTLNVVNSTLSGNTANNAGSCGGGIFNEGALTIVNSTLSGNTAPLGGGGLCTFSGAATVINSTIANNTSTANGGGIRADSSVTLRNTIVADSVTSVDITGFFDTTNGNNLIENPGIVVVGATNITGQDPVLGPLTNNGGLTFTHALLATSPAVKAAAMSTCRWIRSISTAIQTWRRRCRLISVAWVIRARLIRLMRIRLKPSISARMNRIRPSRTSPTRVCPRTTCFSSPTTWATTRQ